MIEVAPEDAPRLGRWLATAAKGVAIVPATTSQFHVFVHNGKAGNEVGRIAATCTNELDAEMLATALWSLVEDVMAGEKDSGELLLPPDVDMGWKIRPFIAAYDLP